MLDGRDTIHWIRHAVATGVVPSHFRAADVNHALGIHWAGVFLQLFVQIDRGLYRLK